MQISVAGTDTGFESAAMRKRKLQLLPSVLMGRQNEEAKAGAFAYARAIQLAISLCPGRSRSGDLFAIFIFSGRVNSDRESVPIACNCGSRPFSRST